jgi:hypothetical protein
MARRWANHIVLLWFQPSVKEIDNFRRRIVPQLALALRDILLIHPNNDARYLKVLGSRASDSHHQTQNNDDDSDENRHKENVAIVFDCTTVSSLHPG